MEGAYVLAEAGPGADQGVKSDFHDVVISFRFVSSRVVPKSECEGRCRV